MSTAILFTEKEFFDDVWEERRIRQGKRRREDASLDLPPPKRTSLCINSTAAETECGDQRTVVLPGTTTVTSNDAKMLRDSIFTSAPTSQDNGPGIRKRGRKEIDPTINRLINTDSQGFMCRRKVFKIYFEGASSSEFPMVDKSNELLN